MGTTGGVTGVSGAWRLWMGERRIAVGLGLDAGRRALAGVLTWPGRLRVSLGASRAPAIVLVPQDLRTTDPVRADEFAAGIFTFAGRTVEATDPFTVLPPGDDWAEALATFVWLRHLRASGTPEAAETGRRLVRAWLEAEGGSHPATRSDIVVAERIRAFIGASGLLLADADQVFYRRFVRSLWRQVRDLEARLPQVAPGKDRLIVLIALVTAALCMSGEEKLLARASRLLGEELQAQILPDGCHVSRHPGIIVGLILDLLPLRQLFPARNATPPAAIVTAVDRMMPMIRFFQLGDGTLGRFNGMGPTAIDQVATALVYDDTRGTAPLSAGHGGYERLEAGSSVVLVDAGAPPPARYSGEAHAGCLSFEFSAGRDLIVANCGVPPILKAAWRIDARKTAAHSTVSVANRSSFRLGKGIWSEGLVLSGPGPVTRERRGLTLTARHDGYRGRLGVVHSRRLDLAATGDRLAGEDRIEGSDQPYVLRFHLHPAVEVIPTEHPRSALLRLPGGDGWRFVANQPVAIEESVALAQAEGPRRALQIVIAVASSEAVPAVAWAFQRLDRPQKRAEPPPEPELPLG